MEWIERPNPRLACRSAWSHDSRMRCVPAEILFLTVTGVQILSTVFGKFYDVAVGVADEHEYHVVGEADGTACNFYAHPFQGGWLTMDGGLPRHRGERGEGWVLWNDRGRLRRP